MDKIDQMHERQPLRRLARVAVRLGIAAGMLGGGAGIANASGSHQVRTTGGENASTMSMEGKSASQTEYEKLMNIKSANLKEQQSEANVVPAAIDTTPLQSFSPDAAIDFGNPETQNQLFLDPLAQKLFVDSSKLVDKIIAEKGGSTSDFTLSPRVGNVNGIRALAVMINQKNADGTKTTYIYDQLDNPTGPVVIPATFPKELKFDVYVLKGDNGKLDRLAPAIETKESFWVLSADPATGVMSFVEDKDKTKFVKTDGFDMEPWKTGTTSGQVNLRQGEGTDTPALTQVPPATEVPVIEGEVNAGANNWVKVISPDGKVGYLRGDFVQVQSPNPGTGNMETIINQVVFTFSGAGPVEAAPAEIGFNLTNPTELANLNMKTGIDFTYNGFKIQIVTDVPGIDFRGIDLAHFDDAMKKLGIDGNVRSNTIVQILNNPTRANHKGHVPDIIGDNTGNDMEIMQDPEILPDGTQVFKSYLDGTHVTDTVHGWNQTVVTKKDGVIRNRVDVLMDEMIFATLLAGERDPQTIWDAVPAKISGTPDVIQTQFTPAERLTS